MDVLLGLLVGGLLTLAVFIYTRRSKDKHLVNTQSIVLLDKIKKVCKFITVEGDFAEIYQYEDVKQRFLNLVSSRKRALIVIKAKVHIGINLSGLDLKANTSKRTITIHHFPEAEVLSIETNLDYYDKSEGLFNKFEASDLTELHKEAKQHINDKIPESGLLKAAQEEALETILLMQSIVETIGWQLNYSALAIDPQIVKKLDASQTSKKP